MDNEIVWTTRDGRQMTMGQIGDNHLNNIIKMLKREYLKALSVGYQASSFLRGEMAIASVDSALDHLEENFLEVYTPFVEEQERRREKELENA